MNHSLKKPYLAKLKDEKKKNLDPHPSTKFVILLSSDPTNKQTNKHTGMKT